jgi:hypothetical protein
MGQADNIPQKLLMPNTTQIPNVMLDVIMPAVSPGTWKIISCVARQTYGWQKRWDAISISTVQKKTGLSNRFVIDTMEEMREAGLLLRREGERKEFGYEYSLNTDCDMVQVAELLKTVERQPRIKPSGGRKTGSRKGEAGSEAGSPEAMNPVHEDTDSAHEPTSHPHELSADAASSQVAMNSVPEAMNPVHTQKPTIFKTNYSNQRGASPSVLMIAQRQFMKALPSGWKAFESSLSSEAGNPARRVFEHVRVSALEAGLDYGYAKELLAQHPDWKTWPSLQLLDSQQEIHFPEPKPAAAEQVMPSAEMQTRAARVWEYVRDYLKHRMNPMQFDTWIKPLKPWTMDGRILFVRVPTPEFRQVAEKFGELLEKAIEGRADDIKFVASEEQRATA